MTNARRLQSAAAITYVKNNDVSTYVEPSVSEYRTGTEALLNARCSTWLASNGIAGATECKGARTKWYAESANGCSRDRLELVDTSVYEPRAIYLSRFSSPTPPPRPPPKPPPPLPPNPPSPSPPPSPPRFASRDAALGFAAKIQRDFCDSYVHGSLEAFSLPMQSESISPPPLCSYLACSVYILSAETRCNVRCKHFPLSITHTISH